MELFDHKGELKRQERPTAIIITAASTPSPMPTAFHRLPHNLVRCEPSYFPFAEEEPEAQGCGVPV